MDTEYTVDQHFVGKEPIVRKIYDRLVQKMSVIGNVSEDPKKTSIHLNHHTALAGVATRKNYLLLNIKSARPLESPRFRKAEKLSASRYHQETKLEKPEDVDEELLLWLQAAYELSA
ncbi:MAG: DUF5655 domain-containing protein [Caldilineaceae bacterium]